MATALQAQPDDAIFDAQQLDVAAVGAKEGPYSFKSLMQPCFEVERMQIVQQEQAGYYIIAGAAVEDGSARLAFRHDDFEEALQPDPMQIKEGLHDLPNTREYGRIGVPLHFA